MNESKEYYQHNKLIEYNLDFSEPNDNYTVLLNIKGHIPVLAYKKDDNWYETYNDTRLEVEEKDIISFMQVPMFKFYKRQQ